MNVKKYFNNKKLEKVLEDKYTSLRAYQNYKEFVENDLNIMLNTEIVDWIDYECVDELKLELNRLDYLKELGVNGIYFCPITEGATNHRYDTIDYMKIDKKEIINLTIFDRSLLR